MRGLIGKKIGMSHIFTDDGEFIPVTVLNAGPCIVVGKREQETDAGHTKDGYSAVILGFGEKKKTTKPYAGMFKKLNLKPPKLIREMRNWDENMKTGDIVTVDIFKVGSKVSVTGYSKGKGFTGVVKKYGFKGGPGSHGSTFHRRAGSIGSSATPSRVWKGRKMPGRMGTKKVTVKNLEIVKVEKEKNFLFVKGQVPGPKNGIVIIKQC